MASSTQSLQLKVTGKSKPTATARVEHFVSWICSVIQLWQQMCPKAENRRPQLSLSTQHQEVQVSFSSVHTEHILIIIELNHEKCTDQTQLLKQPFFCPTRKHNVLLNLQINVHVAPLAWFSNLFVHFKISCISSCYVDVGRFSIPDSFSHSAVGGTNTLAVVVQWTAAHTCSLNLLVARQVFISFFYMCHWKLTAVAFYFFLKKKLHSYFCHHLMTIGLSMLVSKTQEKWLGCSGKNLCK